MLFVTIYTGDNMKKLKGFYDSHLHVLGLGFNMNTIDLGVLKSIDEVSNNQSDIDLIFGRGWHEENFKEKRSLHKNDLESISTDEPIIFLRVCGHVLVCNDKAMELAGINKDTPQIEGGSFDYNTGIFTEDAIKLIYKIMPQYTKEDIKEMFVKTNDYLLSQGITSVASDDFSTLQVDYELVIEALKEVYEEGRMQIRLTEQVNLPSIELLNDFISKGYVNKDFGGFKMGPLKLLADGSLGGRTAYLNDDYSDDIGNRGIQVFKQEELEELIYLADSNNMDVAIHAIGDGMIDIIISAIEKSLLKTKRKHRHSIIHCQLATKAQINRMKDLGISAIVQPIFLNSDIPIIERRLGDRAKESYLFHTIYKEGVKVGFSTDAPIETVNPFENIYAAITRKSIKHKELEPFLINEAFTLDEALECYTKTNYWLTYDEHKQYNDYIIIDKDIHNCDIEELKNINVLETYIDGKRVNKRNKEL